MFFFFCEKINRHARNRDLSHLKRSIGQTALSGRDASSQPLKAIQIYINRVGFSPLQLKTT